MRLLPFAIAVALVAKLACGCNQQSNAQVGYAVVGATAAPLTTYTPTGPFPRGQVNPAHLPARQGPTLQVLSPARGAQTSGTTVDVEVSAVDPDGVQTVTIAGAAAAARGGDRYGATVILAPGLNLLEVAATDGRGDRSTGSFAVVQGRFVQGGTFAPACAQVRLDPEALEAIRRDAEARLATLDLQALIQGLGRPTYQTSIVTVDVTQVTHGPPRLPTLAASAGTIHVTAELDALSVDLDVKAIVRGHILVTADKARVDVYAAIQPPSGTSTGARLLGLDVTRVDVSFDNLKLTPRSGLANLLLSPFQGLLTTLVRSQLDKVLTKAIGNALNKPLPGVDTPLTVNLPAMGGTRPVELVTRIETGRGWTGAGLDLAGGLSVTAKQPHPHALPAEVLVTNPALPTFPWSATDDVGVALSSDGLNAFAHAYWRTGAGWVALDGTKPTTKKTPLSAKLLYPFFPVARDLAPDPMTPMVIEASAQAPPVLRLGAPQGSVTVLLPEVEVSVFFDYMDGGPRVELLRVRVSLEGAVDPGVSGGDIVLANLRAAQLGFDIIAEPAADLDDQGVEAFLAQAVPTVVNALKLPNIPIPALPQGLQLVSPSIEARDGWLIVRAGVR